jgi:hypothetical protein
MNWYFFGLLEGRNVHAMLLMYLHFHLIFRVLFVWVWHSIRTPCGTASQRNGQTLPRWQHDYLVPRNGAGDYGDLIHSGILITQPRS